MLENRIRNPFSTHDYKLAQCDISGVQYYSLKYSTKITIKVVDEQLDIYSQKKVVERAAIITKRINKAYCGDQFMIENRYIQLLEQKI